MTAKSTGQGRYIPPTWFDRRLVGAIPMLARLMSAATGDVVLKVRGRQSGRTRTTMARPVTFGGKRYLVAIRGETQWARNLRAAGQAVMEEKGRQSHIRATEVFGDERKAVVEAFLASSKYTETRRIMSEILPHHTQHPVFRIEPLA